MLIIYRFLINLVLILSPIIIIYRLFKKKEDIKRFKEKFCFFTKKKVKGRLIWFHGASVGELQSIVPILEILEKEKKIKQILITSNTLSSSKIIQKFNSKKIVHQFFPIDTFYLSKKFLNYWNPSSAFFIDSEIWPNMLDHLNHKNIPTALINGRITKKTYVRWKNFPIFSKKIFNKFNLCLSCSNESKSYLIKLGAKKVKSLGNLKFAQSENEKIKVDDKLKRFILSKRSWCASSTHPNEETICGSVHKKLKKKYPNLLTIIIPRHIDRSRSIDDELKKLNLKTQIVNGHNKIDKNAEILIIESYGQTKSFYSICKNVFLGGSLINHGGQNPLEATRFGCNIMHGPYISNFKEIFKMLKSKNMSIQINNEKNMTKILNNFFKKKTNFKKKQAELNRIGKKTAINFYKEICSLANNEI